MTDAETELTADLLRRNQNADHTVIVVEHDMTFVRALGVKVSVLHEGSVLAEGSLDQVSSDQRRHRESIWDGEDHARGARHRPALRRGPGPCAG